MLQIDDIEPLFSNREIKVILIGRGFSSRMAIDSALQEHLLSSGVILQALSTPEAVKRYNEIDHKHLLALFHLTC